MASIVANESARVVKVIRRLATGSGGERLDEIEERLVAFGQIADFGRPVIHLDIDVDVVIRAPRRGDVLRPDAL